MEGKQIALCGSGHGAAAAFRSLADKFDTLCVVSDDTEIVKMMRPNDRRVKALSDFNDFVIVCAGFTNRVCEEILSRNTVVNTHPSLLPKYRGMHSLVWAILNDDPTIGFSIHLMNNEMDDGDILAQYETPNNEKTSAEIWSEFDRYVQENLSSVISRFLDGSLQPVKQDLAKATWVPKRNLKDCEMVWTETNSRLSALMRALVPPYPYPLIRTPKNLYSVLEADVLERSYYCTVGRVVGHHGGTEFNKSAVGMVRLSNLYHAETEKPVSVNEALPLGLRLPIG